MVFCMGYLLLRIFQNVLPSIFSSVKAWGISVPRSVIRLNNSEILTISGCRFSIFEISVDPHLPVPITKAGAFIRAMVNVKRVKTAGVLLPGYWYTSRHATSVFLHQ